MKIAMLTTDNRDHCRDYSKSEPYFGTAPEGLLQGFAGMEGVEVHVVSCTQRPMASPDKLASNIFFHSVHAPKMGWLRTGYQGCIRAVRRRLKCIEPDIVHGQGTERDCAISAVFSGYPNVLTIHGNMRVIAELQKAKPFTFYWLAARLEQFTLPRSDGVVCITNYTRELVRPFSKRTWVLPNAADQRFFDVNSAPDPSAPPRILYVGAVTPRKNQIAVIRALEPLVPRFGFQVDFLGQVGEGDPYGAEFLQGIATRPWCSFHGFADRDSLRRYFQRATLVLLASLEDNCPMVVLEAMASRVPVVASHVGGIPELMTEEVTGLFCDPADIGSIRAAVERALSDPDAAKRRAVAAKEYARTRFHPRAIAQRHLEIYREVLSIRL
jgi:glycosyltransferase involved in cell wall biosynthesis